MLRKRFPSFLIPNSIRCFSTKKSVTKRYLKRQSNDEFSAKAREHNFRARSAFKLLEIDEKFKIFKPDDVVLDIGCAPGSWLQVAVDKCPNGQILGVDLQNVLPIKGAEILSLSDVTHEKTQNLIREKLKNRYVNVVLSDMAPNPTGDNSTDHLRIIKLCQTVFHLFQNSKNHEKGVEPVFNLAKNGVFLCKIWDGSLRNEFMDELSTKFASIRTVKPLACRDNSAELYLLCRKLK